MRFFYCRPFFHRLIIPTATTTTTAGPTTTSPTTGPATATTATKSVERSRRGSKPDFITRRKPTQYDAVADAATTTESTVRLAKVKQNMD